MPITEKNTNTGKKVTWFNLFNDFDSISLIEEGIVGLKIIIRDGTNKNVVVKEIIKPIVIIHPKSITGLISLNTNETKAHIVVKTA